MAKWTFEPGHTAAEFCVRHMMVTWVRGGFKDVHGTLEWDKANPLGGSVEVIIDARKMWSGEPARDAHLASRDFLDVAAHPMIKYDGRFTDCIGENDYRVRGELAIRGVVRRSLSRFVVSVSGGRPGGKGIGISGPKPGPASWPAPKSTDTISG
jgi:polyisoprenoid-binding protein YceI